MEFGETFKCVVPRENVLLITKVVETDTKEQTIKKDFINCLCEVPVN